MRIYNVEKEPKISDWKTFEFEERCKEIVGSKISGTKVHRVVKLEKNVEAIVKPIEVDLPLEGKIEVTPLFFVKYWFIGKILISLIFENAKDCTTATRNELKKTLTKLIIAFIYSPHQK